MEIKEINIEEINRRLGYLSTKYPEGGEIPQSIEQEQQLLAQMKGVLGHTANEFEIAKDGTKVPKGFYQSPVPGEENQQFVDYYNKVLEQYNEVHEKNVQSELISQEEQDVYKFPELDIDALREEMKQIKSKEELRTFYSEKVASRPGVYYSNEDMKKLKEFSDELWSNPDIAKLPETAREEVSQTVYSEEKEDKPVNISKFSQIYQKAKGRIKTAFEHIRNFMSRNKEQPEKSKDENDKTIDE